MARLRLAHTADLDVATRRAVRVLLDESFAGELTDQDWENTLGGMHALRYETDTLIGHAALIQRRLLHAGRALRTGYVEALAVHSSWRRRGHGAALMVAMERLIRGAYQLGALSTTEQAVPFYAARGWQLWRGQTYALTPNGITRTSDDDGGIYVLPVDVPLDLTGGLTCDWRDGDLW